MLSSGEERTGINCVTEGFASPSMATSNEKPQSMNPNERIVSNRRYAAIVMTAMQAAINSIVSKPLEAGKCPPMIPRNVKIVIM